jgi:26S proteasome regulatory subunit N5
MVTITKRRGQAKKPITDMVQLFLNTFVEALPTREEKYLFVVCLKDVSNGKIYLEREYAKVIKIYCQMLEQDGETQKATDIIQEIQIETYGSVETKEKVEFILYQMKLVHSRRDFVRLQIMSRKLAKKQLAMDGFELLKIEYYHFLVHYHVHEKMHLEIAKNYQIILDVYSSKEGLDTSQGESNKKHAFENFCLYLLVSPYGDERQALLKTVTEKYARQLDQNEMISFYVKKFLGAELIPLNEPQVEAQMTPYTPFKDAETENAGLHLRELVKQII